MNDAALDSNYQDTHSSSNSPPHLTHVSQDSSAQIINIPPKLPPSSFLDPGALNTPLTPTTPTTPTSPIDPSVSSEGRQKKSNPLVDLIETEKSYVDLLTGIIRKVAAAWSRTNLPPPELDTMFRSIESVYKANRALLLKLKEIGINPSSPKALGDLLMRWIDDLEGPYTNYAFKYCRGFDEWEPVSSNPRLPTVLSNFSAANPPQSSASLNNSADPSIWTLDDLFLLPNARLKYYKKLYSRLLKSTTPGRSDHRLLVGALERLDKLLGTLESRQDIRIGSLDPVSSVEPRNVTTDHLSAGILEQNARVEKSEGEQPPGSETSSARGSSVSDGERLSRETVSTSISRVSTATMSMPVTELEHRLSTQRTLDIFTMKPKVVRLQMSPPSLPFTREMRFSVDVLVKFTPRATGVEVVHRQGHVFLLSDLFLICERMTSEERAQNGSEGADMWLCYPPLAGKVLRVAEIPGQDTALQVAIMRKETLTLETESSHVRNFMISEFKECIEFAGSVTPLSKQTPPPVPPLNGLPKLGTPIDGSDRRLAPGPETHATSPPVNRIGSPSMPLPGAVRGPERVSSMDPNARLVDSLSNTVFSPDGQSAIRKGPPLHHPVPGHVPMYPRAPPSAQGFASPPPMFPLTRSTSAGPHVQHDPNFHPNINSPPNMGRPPPGSFPHQFSPPPSIPPLPGAYVHPSGRAPSDPSFHGGIRKSPSTRSLASHYEHGQQSAPPLPPFPGGYPPNATFIQRNNSHGSLHTPQPHALLPSMQLGGTRVISAADASFAEPSPPNSPVEETPRNTGPMTSTISAQMKCKVFLQQQHAQWKSLGSAKLKLYRQDPTNIKQLVVEAEKDKTVLISTIVLTDGVERVGKTGVAIELSDKGARTGIVYMIQLRNETSAGGLFNSLLAGSDRSVNSRS